MPLQMSKRLLRSLDGKDELPMTTDILLRNNAQLKIQNQALADQVRDLKKELSYLTGYGQRQRAFALAMAEKKE